MTFTKRADGVKDVVCSTNATFYITTTGELYGCGNNAYGQQGSGATTTVSTFTKRADNVEKIYVSVYTPDFREVSLIRCQNLILIYLITSDQAFLERFMIANFQ